MLEYIYIQKAVDAILAFLKEKFGEVVILESYLVNYRFKVVDNVRLSAIFGELERSVIR